MTQSDLILTNAAERHKNAGRNGSCGEQQKRRGQQQVVENESREWRERALFLLRVYVKGLGPGSLFAMEDARAYMDTCGLPAPHHHNCWGSLPSQALGAGIPIKRTGRTRPANSPRTHSHPVTLWEVTA